MVTVQRNPYMSLDGPPDVDVEGEVIRISAWQLALRGSKSESQKATCRDAIQDSVWRLLSVGAVLPEDIGTGYHTGHGLRGVRPAEGWIRTNVETTYPVTIRDGSEVELLWSEWIRGEQGTTWRLAYQIRYADGLTVEFTTLNSMTPAEAYAHGRTVLGWLNDGSRIAESTGCTAWRRK